MRDLYERHAAWSNATFGDDRGPQGPLNHLTLEVQEAKDNPEDPSEFADCLFLIWDAARRAGFDYEALRAAAEAKFAVLLTRTYPQTPDGVPSQHVKDAAHG